VGERIYEYVAEAKKIHNNIKKELTKHKLEAESDLTNIRSGIYNIREGLVEETLNAVWQKVDSAGRNTAPRLGAFSLKLDRFQQQLAEVYRQRKDGLENKCETRIEDDKVITLSGFLKRMTPICMDYPNMENPGATIIS